LRWLPGLALQAVYVGQARTVTTNAAPSLESCDLRVPVLDEPTAAYLYCQASQASLSGYIAILYTLYCDSLTGVALFRKQ
jgi:hypothetical protein